MFFINAPFRLSLDKKKLRELPIAALNLEVFYFMYDRHRLFRFVLVRIIYNQRMEKELKIRP